MKKKTTIYNSIFSIIDGWLDYQRIQYRLPSISVGIIHKQTPLFLKSYGYAELETKRKARPTTAYRIASISKLFSAVAIMQLYERRRLSLDDRVSQYLPWFQSNKDTRLKKITIRQLLNHSSGLQRDGHTGHWESEEFPSLQQIQSQIQQGVTVFSPNERWRYSNVGYTIIGQLIEVISGLSYKEYISQNIQVPLQLFKTDVDITRASIPHLARGYSRYIDDIVRTPFPHLKTNVMQAATGYYSTVGDLCRFLAAQCISNNQLLDPELKKEMQRVQWYDEEEDVQWGLGFERWRNGTMTLIGHNGGFHGYSAQVGFDPKHELGVVVLINAIDGHAYSITNGLFHFLSYAREHSKTSGSMPSVTLSKYEGRFYSIWDDFDIRVFGKDLVMVYVGANRPMQSFFYLRPIGTHRFKKVIPGAKVRAADEEVQFEFNRLGKVAQLRIGPSVFYPFAKVQKKQKKTSR